MVNTMVKEEMKLTVPEIGNKVWTDDIINGEYGIKNAIESGTEHQWIRGFDKGHVRPLRVVGKGKFVPYLGRNAFMLAMLSMHSDPRFIGKGTAKKHGASVEDLKNLKNAKSYMVVFTNMYPINQETKKRIPEDWIKENPAEWQRLKDNNQVFWKRTLPQYRWVYNVEDIPSLELAPLPEMKLPNEHFTPSEMFTNIIEEMDNAPKIVHNNGDRNFYRKSEDTIVLVDPRRYPDENEYYSTAFHELVHSTGHETRCDRPNVGHSLFGSEQYAKEELVAELGAMMLCQMLGIKTTTNNSKEYLRNWLSALENDTSLLYDASELAYKAIDNIWGGMYE